jgi:formylmethanofuran dehydrogenase subunit A
VVEGFQKTRYTIKRGRVVSRDGEIIVDGANATFWVNAKVPQDLRMENDPEFIRRFEQFYTVRMSNYPVQDVYLPRGRCIETEAFT